MGTRIILAALAIALVSPTARGESISCGAPAEIGDGWPIATPASVGLDSAVLCPMASRFAQANVHGVLVARRGTFVFEQYFSGRDRAWVARERRTDFGPQVKHDLRSITKSVVSLLLGIAIGQKKITSLDQPALSFFPGYGDLKTADKQRIHLHHLLTMSSGLGWNETTSHIDPGESRLGAARDSVRYVLALPVAAPPGTKYNYSGGDTHLLGAVITQATGEKLRDFARAALFEPLGITDWQWMSYDNGALSAASGLRLRPRDLLKIGQLVLGRGAWNGRQVVPADWIEQSTRPQIDATDFLYGYQWWLGRALLEGRELPWVAGFGLGGQRLFIVPALDLAVVVTAGLYTSPAQHAVPWEIFRRHVLSSIREGTSASPQ
jgi:CubicO group peptidase (beta-lactamase class C family)